MKRIIGVTGQTGSGKSRLCSEIIKSTNAYIIDCDKLTREIENDEYRSVITGIFGKSVVKNGKLDRKAVAKIAFSTAENTERLNNAVFPIIIKELKKRISESNADTIIIDAPTLFESGADKLCDITVSVLADKEIRKARIINRDGLDNDFADLRMTAEKEDGYFTEKSDFIITNDGDIDKMTGQFLKIINSEVL